MYPQAPLRPDVHPETFVALRARRQAHRVVRDLTFPPLDPYQFYCRRCGLPLDLRDLDGSDQIRCAACADRTTIPRGAVEELRRRRTRRWGRPPRSLVRDAAIAVYVLVAILLVFAIL
jgi:hypothetical protein